jgi:hypothetical protein
LSDTLALAASDTLQKLAWPSEEVCDIRDAVSAVTDELAFRFQQLSQTNQNQIVNHHPFTPRTREVDLSGATNVGTPAWIERLISTVPTETYQFVPACNLNALEEARLRGEFRCAFYGENGQLKVHLSYDPQFLLYRKHRFWYNPSPVLASALNSSLNLPPNFVVMISAGARVRLIPGILLKLAQWESAENPTNENLINAWNLMLGQAQDEMKDWNPVWKKYVFAGTGDVRGRDRRSVLSQGSGILFPGGY